MNASGVESVLVGRRSVLSGRTLRRIAAVTLVGIFIASGLALLPGATATFAVLPVGHGAVSGHGPGTLVRTAGHGVAPHPMAPPLPPAPLASGPGTFYTTTEVPNAAVGQQYCYFGTCANVSNDPSANLTSKGLLAVAYTAYTNQSPCPNKPWAFTEIGLVTSTNLGSSWSTPKYLGNPVCGLPLTPTNYSSAWEPSLTSLPDGTLVLAYIEYNTSNPYVVPPQLYFGYFGQFNVNYDRLVISESHDNGTTWTTPTVLNTSVNLALNNQSWAPLRPSITAFGNTIYVTWMNDSQELGYNFFTFPPVGTGSAAVHMLVSLNGGVTWGSMINLKVESSTAVQYAMNPNVLVTPSGEVFVAYVTNLAFHYQYKCYGVYCLYYQFSDQVVVASSTNNGTTLSYTDVGPQGLALSQTNYAARAFSPTSHDPAPQLAYSRANGQLYIVYGGGWVWFQCYSFGCFPALGEQAYITNSSNLGLNWTTPHLISSALGGGPGPTNQFDYSYNPAIAVNSTGAVEVEATWQNASVCISPFGFPQCGGHSTAALVSTDNGTTFSNPVPVSFVASGINYGPDGDYQTAISAGSHLWFFWTSSVCTSPTYACYWLSNTVLDQVGVSQPFTGTGYNVTYVENGLAPGVRWTVTLDGNVRGGIAPTNLTVSRVPLKEYLTWTVSNTTGGYGVRYSPTGSIRPPVNLSGNLTIYENYSKQFLLNIESNPAIPGCSTGVYYPICFNYTYYPEVNWNMNPLPGSHWAPAGKSYNLSVFPSPTACTFFFCYYNEENLSFLSWTGTGAGAVNSLSHNISIVALGPINETANFRFLSYCLNASGTWSCNTLNESLFFRESGLPAGVKWGAQITSSTLGTTAQNFSTTPTMTITSNATSGVVTYFVYSVPAPGTGKVWVPTGVPASPVELPGQSLVNVTFRLVNATQVNFTNEFMETGLPNSTAWSLDLDGGLFGVQGTTWNLTIPGGMHSVNGSYVYLNGGVSYYAQSIDVLPGVLNLTWQNTSAPAVVNLEGPSLIIVHYAPMYWVTVGGSSGGSVSASSQYVRSGGTLTLTATPNAGFRFVGWSGTGVGSRTTNGTVLSIAISPGAPVTEFATFQPIPPAVFTVHVTETGLPAGVSYSVVLGGVAYSSTAASFNVTGFNGTYSLGLPYAALNASNLTRFVPAVASTTFTSGVGGLSIVANGWLNLTYTTQFVLSVIATGNGTVSPVPGNYWTNAAASVTLTATADPHYRFVGWVGTGNGSQNATSASITFTANGPITETGQFVWRPATPPAVFWLKVTETNLPSGTPWNVSTGALGSYGTTALLTVSGLNGTYNVTVPDVYVGQGTRWVADHGSQQLTVTSNGSLSVAFSEEFEVTVTGSSGGTVSPSGSQWVAKDGTVMLTATAASGYTFVSWNGSGTASYTGTGGSQTLTVSGPVTELATFAPVYPTQSTGSASAGETSALGLLAALLVVGVVVGLIAGRRRSPPPAAPPVESELPMEPEP